MAKGRVYISDYPKDSPEWYWVRGLHDACVLSVECVEFPFDYNKFVAEKAQYNRNLMTLKIDAKGALYDSRVKEIRLFNYKILTDHALLEGRQKLFWMADRLVDHGEYYTLEIDLQDIASKPRDFTLKIKFERAEVDRE